MLWMIVCMSICMGSFCGGATAGSSGEVNVLKTNHVCNRSLEPDDQNLLGTLHGNIIEAYRMDGILPISHKLVRREYL